ncbi:MAG TPA: replication-relaxation family protein [Solirubrobacteraceae bacterium]|nr:replication-relaxation family protein [Solirubrobacteraceae bacterium]
MLRLLLWRLLAVLAALTGYALVDWALRGGPGRLLRGDAASSLPRELWRLARAPAVAAQDIAGWAPARLLVGLLALAFVLLMLARCVARARRRYVRVRIDAYRTDQASAEAVVSMYEALHKRLLQRWWRRLLTGQPSVALEVRHGSEPGSSRDSDSISSVSMTLSCPQALLSTVEAALRVAYANCALRPFEQRSPAPRALLRLKKAAEFIKRVKSLDHFEHEREPPIDRLLNAIGATDREVLVQLAMTPTPAAFERLARRAFKRREAHLSRERRAHALVRDRSLVEDVELRGGLDVQHRPLFFTDIRIIARERRICERVASALRADGAENRLVERGTAIRHGLFSLYRRRIERGEGNPLPSFHKGVFATSELASLWHLPSVEYAAVPFARDALPRAPAPPSIHRPREGRGALRDAIGPVSIHPELRRQNTAVPGTVEQGKSSYLVATVAEDLTRERCAVIVLDPKGDAADAVVSLVDPARTCTLLDFTHPTCGFNPLMVDAPADVIADYVVAALKHLFSDTDIRASSDRYLRNAIIAVLAYDRGSTLWDAARLLSVGEEGYAYRRAVGARVRTLPAFKEISDFFTAELSAQLADARSTTTAKLDAPVNKLARLLNSASIKRVLLNDSLTIDFERVIAEREVLVVKGALGGMGAGNTSVLMQLLVGMLDAALARQQDLVPAERRVAVALKVDEAPLVLNRGFAETMALKRSAGLETVACWQSEAQWEDRDVREQLDALFAHRVYFATASALDARAGVSLTMAEFSDTVRPGVAHLGALGRPDARLHLPKYHAIVSWTTPRGRQAPFIAQTIPLEVDRERIALHAERQAHRGGRHRSDLRQPHWQRAAGASADEARGSVDALAPALKAALSARSKAPFAGDALAHPAAEAMPALPDVPSESFRELVELDLAQSVRWAKRAGSPVAIEADALDLAMLELIGRLEHVLSSQLHRRFNRRRAITTTQRRLKRLSDAGLVDRFQFHRRDGGGVPMCYVLSPSGRELLRSAGRIGDRSGEEPRDAVHRDQERRLRQARHDVHVAGWALAFLEALDPSAVALRGAVESIVLPPSRTISGARVGLGPADLRLPGGRVAHDFLCVDHGQGEREVERFDAVRPDALIELRESAVDLMIERDDRLATSGGAAKLLRYDHFLTGWSLHTRRYREREATPFALFVCRSRDRARECARAADVVLRAARAYAGEYPFDWDYSGRERILFVAERDVHEGVLGAYGVPRLPPSVRISGAHGDPAAGSATTETRSLPR